MEKQTTDSNGNIPKQVLQRAVYSRATDDVGNFDTTVNSNPHYFEINADGYVPKEYYLNITEETKDTKYLETDFPWTLDGTLILSEGQTPIFRKC